MGALWLCAAVSVLDIVFLTISAVVLINDGNTDFPYSMAYVGGFFFVWFMVMYDRIVMLFKDGRFLFHGKVYSTGSVVSLEKDIYAFGNVLKLKLFDGTEYYINVNAKTHLCRHKTSLSKQLRHLRLVF